MKIINFNILRKFIFSQSKHSNSRSEFLFNKNILNSKHSQHEIVGFTLIVIIVSIIGLIFLSFSIGRGEKIEKTSVEISDFLQSSLYYTTECSNGDVPNYKDMQGLIKSCYKNEDCFGGRNSCEVLNETISKIIRESFQVSEVSRNKAYKLNMYYKDLHIKDAEEILKIEEGVFEKCSSRAGASQAIFMGAGNINIELDICYG